MSELEDRLARQTGTIDILRGERDKLRTQVTDRERELAVARQTIRSLQDALAAEHKDDEALQRELDNVHNALAESNVPRSDGVDEPLWSEARRVRWLGEREQELTNALRILLTPDGKTRFVTFDEERDLCTIEISLSDYADAARGAALAPAVEEQR